jgi:hypothetical protein
MPTAHELVAALAGEDRLRVYGRIVVSGAGGIGLAELDRELPGAARHVPRLRKAGLVTRDEGGRLRADAGTFRATAFRAMPGAGADVPDGARGPVAKLFSKGRLVAIPSKREPRRALLEFLAADLFEPDRAYSEPEVNAALSRYHEDRSSLRRYLIEARLLVRTPDGAEYRRATG